MTVDRDCADLNPSTRPVTASGRSGYLAVLRLPGAMGAFLPVAAGRLALATVTLSVLLMVQSATGSFALAGATTGALGLTSVVASPWRARLVDRHGQRAVLPVLAALYVLGLWGITLAVTLGAPAVAVVAAAALTGLTPPPLGAAMRVLWAGVTPPGPLRLRAFSVDSLSEDLAFTLGPLIVSVFLILGDSRLAVVIAPVVVLLATWALTRSRLSSRHGAGFGADPLSVSEEEVGPASSSLMRQPRFVAALIVMLGLGIALGAVELATAAFAHAASGDALAGAILAAFAGGSAVGSLLYGLRDWRIGLHIRLLILAGVVAFAAGMLTLADVVVVFGGLVALAGFALGPSLITGYLVADAHSGPRNRTQASAWVNTAVNAGASLAAVAIGAIIDAAGYGSGLALAVAATCLCILAGLPWLVRRVPS